MRKLKFYLIGLIPGILLVLFILNQKGASCSGYLPSNRVVAESMSKDFTFAPGAQMDLRAFQLTEEFVKDSIMSKGEIDFSRSDAQGEPCPSYLLSSPKNEPHYEITFDKCSEGVTIKSIKVF